MSDRKMLFRQTTMFVKLFLVIVLYVDSSFGNNSSDITDLDCGPSEFACISSNKCVTLSWKCDGDPDCPDGEDEKNCSATTCTPNFFRCNNGLCISERWVCDGQDDCKDNSDEATEVCAERNTCVNKHKCSGTNMCIDPSLVCDGQPDCPEKDDEKDCSNLGCDKETEFKCHDNNGPCISSRWHCDGSDDCEDGSDEKNCTSQCEKGFKTCADGECINDLWWCDGDADCADKSDEAKCAELAVNQNCSETEFQCQGMSMVVQCVHMNWVCDGDSDCLDESDEKDCKPHTCNPNEIICDKNFCISELYVCDGDKDCEDGTDEFNCTVSCDVDSFDCGNQTCIPKTQLCDGFDHCIDGADESPLHCSSQVSSQTSCEHNNGGCMHLCKPNINSTGRTCECRPGYQLANHSNTDCQDINECETPGTCSQKCVNTKGSYKCDCEPGYTLIVPRYCKAIEGKHAVLILSDSHELRRYSLDEFRYSKLLENPVQRAVAMDFNIREHKVYWTDLQHKQVSVAGVNDVNHMKVIVNESIVKHPMKVIVNESIDMPDGLAVDWVHGNLYLSDTGLDKIEVLRLNGSHRKILVNTDLDEPRALVLDPQYGWIYWSDWGVQPKIEKCGMNGQNRKSIITKHIAWPNGLTIDYIQRRLYWVDAKLHTIGSSDLDGNNYKLILKNHGYLGHPFGITVFEDYLYWTDWMTNGVFKYSKFSQGNVTHVVMKLKTPMCIHAYHVVRQPSPMNHCGDNNGGCSHLCLPKPHEGVVAPTTPNYECACPDGMKFGEGEEKHHCVPSHEVVTNKIPTDQGKDMSNPNRLPYTIQTPPETQTTTKSSSSQETQTNFNQGETTDGVIPALNGTNSQLAHKESEGNGSVAIIVIVIVFVLGVTVAIIVALLIRRHKRKNVKSMNFDNPVYRKTTTDDQLIMEKNGSRSSLPSILKPLTQDVEIV
ncbi:unnamed protein product [Lymnaea stagnalis]|uniref:EGF-like domain-containing protein n=1 Tax=Lymnaea stagnalis TaxID=6523 RepID=A0AAV2IK60_LYMST